MQKNELIKYVLIVLPVLFYFIYSIRYSFVLSKNIFLTRRQTINLILIWIIPFIWVLFLKTFFEPTPGSHQIKRKKDSDSFAESGLGVFDDSSSYHSNDHH